MFVHADSYHEEIKKLISTSRSLSLAVAFWGKGAEKLLSQWQGDRLYILCNLAMGGTNPWVIERLLEIAENRPQIEIKALDSLHAKVVLGEKSAIVGSANWSANGLGFEGAESSGWSEAGICVADPQVLTSIRQWFEASWSVGYGIEEEHLKAARLAWSRNRKGRSKRAAVARLIEAPSEELMDRSIYLAIYREQANEQAHQAAGDARQEAQGSKEPSVRNTKLDFFDNWPDDCEEPLPKNAPVITVRYGFRKAVNVYGAWQRFPSLDKTYIDKKSGEKIAVPILGKLDSVLDWSLSYADQIVLGKRLKPWVDSLYSDNPGCTDARCVALDDFLRWESARGAS